MHSLKFFGGASIEGEDGPLGGPAARRHRLALLALLAATHPGSLSRDKLVGLLWPESTSDHARNLLNQAVHAVRKALGPGAIVSAGDELRLAAGAVRCDIVMFREALAAGDPARAVALYSGCFLDGFFLSSAPEFDFWVEQEREGFARAYAQQLEQLAGIAQARSDLAGAVEWWSRLCAQVPHSSRAVLRLMQALEAVGDRAGAIRQAGVHRALLEQEFGADPDPEIVSLAERLRKATVNVSAAAGPVAASKPADTGAAEPDHGHGDDVSLEPMRTASESPVPTAPVLRAAGGGVAESTGAAHPAPRPNSRRRILLAAAGAIVAAAVVLGLYRGLRQAPDLALDPNLLAIAPFDVLEPSLQLWHEGLGDILSRSLDGAGPLRTVSQTVALRLWEGRSDRASAEALGRRTGAGLVVFGTVVPKGRDSVTLRAGLLDAASGTGQREVEVSGEAARIGELADALGIRLLQALARSRAIGSVRQVSMGSRSLPALKAFLQGEQFYRRGLWDSALTRYDQAITADSTFALALGRMKTVLTWQPPTAGAYLPAEEYSRRSILYNHGLSPRESLLIVSDSFRLAASSATDPAAYVGFSFRSLTAIEETVRRYPEDPEAWYVLGEARMHEPFPIGSPPAAIFETFSRTIALDSGFAPAYEHMADLAIRLGRPELARRYAATYLRLYPDAGSASGTRLALLALDPDQAGAADTARLVDTASAPAIFVAAFNILTFFTDSAETQVRLLRRMGNTKPVAGGEPDFVLDSLMWRQYLAAALAYRGHLREAYETNRVLLLDPAASQWSDFMDPFLDLALLGVVPDSVVQPVFAGAFEPAASWGSKWIPRHLRGLPWWLARRDTVSLTRFAARAAEQTRRSNPPLVALRARLLGATSGAYAALARGDSAGALGLLETIPDTLCLADMNASNCFHFYLTLAQLLAARGDDRRAATLLERWRWGAGPGPSFVLSTLERGRVAERLGERDKAIESYRFVTEAWRRPDPELQPYVTEAREALARLARRE